MLALKRLRFRIPFNGFSPVIVRSPDALSVRAPRYPAVPVIHHCLGSDTFPIAYGRRQLLYDDNRQSACGPTGDLGHARHRHFRHPI